MKKFIYILLAIFTTANFAVSQTVIKDGDLEGGNTYTWTKDKVYMLDGYVYLEDGGVLNIEPGTVIKAKETPTTGDNASALIITRGAQIFAEGTAREPIMFTAEIDDTADNGDLDETDRGLWGGLIVLGKGIIGNSTSETGIEGIPAGEARALFGGNDDTDNSGVIRYVTIRHGGAELAPGDEINGLTLGAVGSGTIVDHVEIFANSDDGIEFFGGTVNVTNAVAAFCGDDSFDWDLGWQGNGQFWFAIQSADEGDNAAEMDGAKPDDNARFSNPTIYNATYIGAGPGGTGKNEHALLFRDGTAGTYKNSIFTSFKDKALQVEDLDSGLDSRQRMENDELVLANNIWWSFGNNASILEALNGTDGKDVQWLADALTAANNTTEDPGLQKIGRLVGSNLDPRPAYGGNAYSGLATYPDPANFFKSVDYKGAFGSTLWIRGWTALDQYGFTPASAQIVIQDADLKGDETYTWTSDNEYLLDGFVYLEEGGKLNIEPGTIIKGKEDPSTSDNASALIITRGAQICAQGTENNPIIFTAEIDDTADNGDLDDTDKGLWGGLIILGKGVLGNTTAEAAIEGIPAGEARALYGGNDDTDNSGFLRYVSIRHGGAELGPGDEINGLTLGGVGSATIIENVEVFANSDDGIEFFGGAVSVKNASVAFCGDDSFDWDLGWRGNGQFWFAIQAEDAGDNGAEMDGAKPDDNARFSQPTIRNATYIGSGPGASAKNEHALLFRDGTGGSYTNSIFTSYKNKAIQVEDLDSGLDSRQRLENGELSLSNNIWWSFGNNSTVTDMINPTTAGGDVSWLVSHLNDNGNTVADPGLIIDRFMDGKLNPTPNASAYDNVADGIGGFFTNTQYKGAFCDNGIWAKGWTALSEYGYFDASLDFVTSSCDVVAGSKIVIKDADLEAGKTYNWTKDNIYCIDGYVYLEDGGKLNIEAGTVIKGIESPTTADNASALIITRGAQINAVGTQTSPIIFTAEIDDTADNGDLDDTDKGLWGGLIILGKGVLGNTTAEAAIEGIPAGEARALYGGNDDTDNSGVLKYISIRHGGAELAPGDEINGLTLGGVGSGTVIENVEVFANSDDGIEFFGGTVSVKGAAVAFAGDDSFDWDLGWRGNGQFWFSIQAGDDGDNGAEMDGAKPDDNARFSYPNIRNATYIGSGTVGATAKNEHALLFRDGTAGTYTNSIFTDFKNKAIQVEDLDSGLDSRQRLENGELVLSNNIWFGFGNNTTLTDMINPTTAGGDVSWLVSHLNDNANTLTDPGFVIDRFMDGKLDPTPGSVAYNDVAGGVSSSSWFTATLYKGAFCDNGLWTTGWTALSEYGYFDNSLGFVPLTCDATSSANDIFVEENGFILAPNVPNPAANFTNFNFSVPESATVSLIVFDASGKQIATVLENERLTGGDYTERFETNDLPIGLYYYSLRTGNVVLTKSFIVQR